MILALVGGKSYQPSTTAVNPITFLTHASRDETLLLKQYLIITLKWFIRLLLRNGTHRQSFFRFISLFKPNLLVPTSYFQVLSSLLNRCHSWNLQEYMNRIMVGPDRWLPKGVSMIGSAITSDTFWLPAIWSHCHSGSYKMNPRLCLI